MSNTNFFRATYKRWKTIVKGGEIIYPYMPHAEAELTGDVSFYPSTG